MTPNKNNNPPSDEQRWLDILGTIASSARSPTPKDAQYCGFYGDEQTLESKLWEYTDHLMPGEADEALFQHVKACDYCTAQLLAIQQAIAASLGQESLAAKKLDEIQAESEDVASSRIRAKSEPTAKVMALIVVMSGDSLRLIRTSGQVDYRRRAVAVRTDDEDIGKPDVVAVNESFEECSVTVLVQCNDRETCELLIEARQPDGKIFKDSLELILNDEEGLPLETTYAQKGKASFTDIEPGKYDIEILYKERRIAVVSLELGTGN